MIEADDTARDVRVGVSACLLGREVRMNGGHCRTPWITDVLSDHVEFVPVCPEVEMGLPVPRPTMRLVTGDGTDDADQVRMLVTKTGEDLTGQIDTWAQDKLDEIEGAAVHGFILKKNSPSCGVFRVKVYDAPDGSPSMRGQGRFALALTRRFPNLPVEEDGRLNDRELRESFLVRVFAYARWRAYLAEDASAKGLVDFHAVHKYALLCTDPNGARELGRLVADGAGDLAKTQVAYEAGLMQSLARRATRGRHVNVMQHLLGFVRKTLTPEDKRELGRLIELYVAGAVPRAAPLALVRHLLRSHEAPAWALAQIYLKPYARRLHRNEAV